MQSWNYTYLDVFVAILYNRKVHNTKSVRKRIRAGEDITDTFQPEMRYLGMVSRPVKILDILFTDYFEQLNQILDLPW